MHFLALSDQFINCCTVHFLALSDQFISCCTVHFMALSDQFISCCTVHFMALIWSISCYSMLNFTWIVDSEFFPRFILLCVTASHVTWPTVSNVQFVRVEFCLS